MLERHAAETGEFLAAIKARPVAAESVDLAKLPADWQTLRPYSASPVPRRLTNGSALVSPLVSVSISLSLTQRDMAAT